jgi:hypothetical protein
MNGNHRMSNGATQHISLNKRVDIDDTRRIARKLLAYCQANDWAGYDPYDALNSRVFRALPFLNFKMARLILTQGVKRFPLNLRPLLLVQRTPNPKGIALFLASLIKLSKMGLLEEPGIVEIMTNKLLTLRSPNKRYSCWGYNFDWQTRGKLVPRSTPNIICSTFAANALLDAFEQSQKPDLLNTALSVADFILDILFSQSEDSQPYFNYTPLERSGVVHNANFLGAAFLCRVSRISGHRRFRDAAFAAARYSVSRQHEDGSWDYGESKSQGWIDNFHTGYNLVALKQIGHYGETSEFDTSVRRGHEFYIAHFFRQDGAPKYYHNTTYPIDIHSVAQSIITLLEFKEFAKSNIESAHSVLYWALTNLWDSRGFFYFQKRRRYTVHIPFMRWSEAWMLSALATYLEEVAGTRPVPDRQSFDALNRVPR